MSVSSSSLAHTIQTRLKLRHYTLLVALGQHGSVTRVAQALGLTQPTVTRALSDIEDIFQMPLFTRTGRGLVPTMAGRAVIARAIHAVAENDALARELGSIAAGGQGRLRLGLIPYASHRVLNATWQHLFEYRPRLMVSSVEDVTGKLLTALRERRLDCAICRFSQADDADGLRQVLLYQQKPRLVVARPSAAALKRQPAVDIASLAEMDWIFPPPGTPIRHMIDAIFSAAGQRVSAPVVEAYAVRSIASALRHMPRGITVLPDDIAQAVAADGAAEVLPQELPWSLPPVGLAWLEGSPKERWIAELREAIQAALR